MGLSDHRSFSMRFRREPPCVRSAKLLRLRVWTDAECPSPLWGCKALCSVTDLPICPSRYCYFFTPLQLISRRRGAGRAGILL